MSRDQHKAMARNLRTAALEKGVQLSHGECLDLVARAAGVRNWNILSARLGAASAGGDERCDFCGLSAAQSERVFSTPGGGTICRRCVEGYGDALQHGDVLEPLRHGAADAAEALLAAKSPAELELYVGVARRRIAEKQVAIDHMDALLSRRPRRAVEPQPGIEATRWAILAALPLAEVAAMRDHQLTELALSQTALTLATALLDRRRAA